MVKQKMKMKLKNEKVEPVQKMMYDEVLLVMMMMTVADVPDREAMTNVGEVMMKKRINVKKNKNRSQYQKYQNVELTLKFRGLCQIWAVTYILLSYQISCPLRHGHLIHKHMKMKSMKRKHLMKKVDKGKIK